MSAALVPPPIEQPADAPAVLDVYRLTRSFDDVQAVSDLSFSVRAGQIFGFVGPNGAGKTTTLRMLATLDTPTSGDAFIDGISVSENPSVARLLVGFMPDQSITFQNMTVFESLDFFARAYGLRGAARRERVASVMAFTQLEPLREKLLTALSKGMRQRVTLARTLLNDPKVLLLDEPADGLDPRARIELRELLAKLAAAGKAIVISSHILTDLSEMCDACGIIEQGKLLARGRVDEILARPGTAQAGTEIQIQLVAMADRDRCVSFLREHPQVEDVSRSPAGVVLRFAGNDLAAHELLKAMLQAGLPVCGFQPRAPNLEDAFMHVTRGLVQ